MRRTVKDIKHLHKCYCNCWESKNHDRVRRLEKHGWVENVWVRDYDNIVRMSVTDRGHHVESTYYSFKKKDDTDIDELGAEKFFQKIK